MFTFGLDEAKIRRQSSSQMKWLDRMDLQLVAPVLAIACLGLGAAIAEVRSRIR